MQQHSGTKVPLPKRRLHEGHADPFSLPEARAVRDDVLVVAGVGVQLPLPTRRFQRSSPRVRCRQGLNRSSHASVGG
jgi:hypothetical protein